MTFEPFCVKCGIALTSRSPFRDWFFCCVPCWKLIDVVTRSKLKNEFLAGRDQRARFAALAKETLEPIYPIMSEVRLIRSMENMVRVLHPCAAGIQRTEKTLTGLLNLMLNRPDPTKEDGIVEDEWPEDWRKTPEE